MKKKNVSIYALMLGFLLSLAACSEDKGESLEQTAAGESFICIEQIIDGCIDIATEVGETKIGQMECRLEDRSAVCRRVLVQLALARRLQQQHLLHSKRLLWFTQW